MQSCFPAQHSSVSCFSIEVMRHSLGVSNIGIVRVRLDPVLVNTVIDCRLTASDLGKSRAVFPLTVSVFRLTASVRGKSRAVFRLSGAVSANPILK
jgi:hypothetical protein